MVYLSWVFGKTGKEVRETVIGNIGDVGDIDILSHVTQSLDGLG
jgi:hypothetical protein